MPEDANAARLRQFFVRHGWLVAIAAAYLYVFPYFPRIRSANEMPRVYLVTAIVDDHTFAIDHGVEAWGPTSDLARYGGHFYANKAPGSSILAAPFYAVARLFGTPSFAVTLWLCRIVTGVIPSLLFLWLLWGFLERYAPDPAIRRLVLVAYAFGSLAMTYSLLYYSHQLSAICIGSAWILGLDVAERRRGLGAMAFAGLLAGMAPFVDYEAAFAGIPLAIYLLARMRARRETGGIIVGPRVWTWLRIARALAIAAIAAGPPIACLLYYHAACFGSPLRTGYNFAVTYAHDHDHGLLGMTTPTWTALFGTMFAPDNGFITLAPWWLLAVPGGIALWRAGDRATVATVACVALAFIYFVSSIGFWRAGWEIGPRYLAAMQPFLLPLVAAGLVACRDRPLAIGAASGAILIGVIIYTLTAATFPYWPDSLHDPLYEVTFRLLRDGAAAPSAARVVGVSGVAGIVPFVLGIAALVGWSIARVARWRGLAISIAVGTAIIAYGWFALQRRRRYGVPIMDPRRDPTRRTARRSIRRADVMIRTSRMRRALVAVVARARLQARREGEARDRGRGGRRGSIRRSWRRAWTSDA